MAVTINNFWGAETGGLEEAKSLTGSVSATGTSPHTGGYCCEITANSADELVFDPYEVVASAGTKSILGFWVNFQTGVTPASEVSFFEAWTLAEVAHPTMSISLDTNGDVIFHGVNYSVLATASNPLTAGEWHFIEIYFDQVDSGDWEFFIDGASINSGSSGDFVNNNPPIDELRFLGDSNLDGVYRVDDIYFMSGATSAADRLGGSEVYLYTSDKTGATPDTDNGAGAAQDPLDDDYGAIPTPDWDPLQDIPVSRDANGSIGVYADTAELAGSLITNGTGGGPNGDSNITGDIKAAKALLRMRRSGGSGSDHFILLGNNTDGTTQFADLDPPLDWATYFEISEASTVVPTSTEYCQIGFKKSSGGQDFACSWCYASILHVPSVAAGFPYHLRRIRRSDMKTLINL